MLSQLGGWELALLCGAAFVAVTFLVRRMNAYQAKLLAEVKRHMDEERQRRTEAERKKVAVEADKRSRENEARRAKAREERRRMRETQNPGAASSDDEPAAPAA